MQLKVYSFNVLSLVRERKSYKKKFIEKYIPTVAKIFGGLAADYKGCFYFSIIKGVMKNSEFIYLKLIHCKRISSYRINLDLR